MNIMLLLLIAEFVIGVIIRIASKKFPSLKKAGKFMLQDVFLTLFLFNSFNIAFSAGLHFKYATPDNTQYYILSTVAAIVGIIFYLIIIFIFQFSAHRDFGEFKQKFKQDWVNRSYIFISVLYRMALGVYMSVSNE